ncbi:MAG: hypothetical protein QM690_14480, partial [Sphingobium sp.]
MDVGVEMMAERARMNKQRRHVGSPDQELRDATRGLDCVADDTVAADRGSGAIPVQVQNLNGKQRVSEPFQIAAIAKNMAKTMTSLCFRNAGVTGSSPVSGTISVQKPESLAPPPLRQ